MSTITHQCPVVQGVFQGAASSFRQEKVRKAIKRVVHASFDTETLGLLFKVLLAGLDFP